MIYPDNMFLDDLYETNSVKRTNNSRRDKDTDYYYMDDWSTEEIKEYFSNDNDAYDRDEEACDCECGDDCECDCEEACDCECGDDCDCID